MCPNSLRARIERNSKSLPFSVRKELAKKYREWSQTAVSNEIKEAAARRAVDLLN